MAAGRPDYYKANILLGRYNESFIPVVLEADGSLLSSSEIKGKDGEVLRNIYVDGEGKLVVKNQAVSGSFNPLYILDDGGDTMDISEWVPLGDGLDPVNIDNWGKEGTKAMKLGVDADKEGGDQTHWTKTTSLGDLTKYKFLEIYIRIYIDTLDYLYDDPHVLGYSFGSDATHSMYFAFGKDDLHVGWNILKCDLCDALVTEEGIDWTDISFQNFFVWAVNGNTHDFYFILDYIIIVEPDKTKGDLINVQVDSYGALVTKMVGNYCGIQKPIEADIAGNLQVNLHKQTLTPIITNTSNGGLTQLYTLRVHPGNEEYTLHTITGKGVIKGGCVSHFGSSSHKTCKVLMTIDGVSFGGLNFLAMNTSKLTEPWDYVPHLTLYDDTNYLYKVSFPKDLIFGSSVVVVMDENVGSDGITQSWLYYALI